MSFLDETGYRHLYQKIVNKVQALWQKVGTATLTTNAQNTSEAINELKGTLDDNTFNTWSDNTRCEFISGGYISMGAYMLVNVVFKAKATATNTPSLVSISPQKPKVDTALNAIDITSGIASSIAESIPCGIASSNGTIFIKKIETDHIYAITGYYLIN